MKYSHCVTVLIAAAVLEISGCAKRQPGFGSDWAMNVGGPAYRGSDGTEYLADESISGGDIGRIESVKGTQDEFLYQSYREGEIEISRPVANGDFDITFHFAEPEDIGGRERLFDIIVNDQVVLEDLDVMAQRDGQVRAGLAVTVPNVLIDDGQLRVRFNASAKQAVLSAIVVRNKNRPAKVWQLVWSDEFDEDGPPDPENWSTQEWPPGVVNNEDQAYTARSKNVRVEDGHLIIEAFREDFDGALYTSGRIHSAGKQDFLYGRFEARAKLPRGQGNWAAIWMLPSDPFRYATNCSDIPDWQGNSDCDAWPNSGEIDILEHVGYLHGHIHGTVHNRAYYFVNHEQRKGRAIFPDVSEKFHEYIVEWHPDRIDMYVDDTLYFTYTNEEKGWREWPFDHPYHWIINLAIGGDWGRAGGPVDDSVFPQRLVVDYVRVYQLQE
ncbi:MAG: family 16 glycosylhydrolase [Gammaproteobacteria bacterium]|nr:family 16 glycosylhydrolase [Gammaproteobacteria bacterium]MDH5302698.1 family 16 glycosylhydrolase [Gammaproteobacteria bacterium]MDH5320866.1 family 16 glycosylhydrolase [Gammaproteobacteria bacterium]